MFKLHNTFTATTPAGAQTVFNTVTDVLPALRDGLAYTAYMILTIGGASHAFPAEVTAINTDPRETVFVERTVQLPPGAYTGRVTAAALSGDGVTPVNTAALDAEADTGLTVTARLYLTWSGDVRCVAGQNRLLRALLGVIPLTGTFALCRGTNLYTDETAERTTGLLTDVYPATVTVDEDGISFSATMQPGIVPETVLLYEGAPVARMVTVKTKVAFSPRAVPATNGVARLQAEYPVEVFSVSDGSGMPSAFDRLYELYAVDGPWPLGLRAPVACRACSDCNGSYLGLYSDTELIVLDGRGRVVRCAAGGTLADVAPDGTTAVFNDGLTVYGTQTERFDLDTPDSFAIGKFDDGLHLAMLYGATLKRYKLADGALTVLEETAITPPAVLFHANNGLLGFCSAGRCEVRSCDVKDTHRSAVLTALYGQIPAGARLIGGNGMFAAVSADSAVVCDLVRGVVWSGAAADFVDLGGAILCVRMDGAPKLLAGALDSTNTVLTDCPADVCAFGTAGDRLLTVTDTGDVAYYGIMKKLAALYSRDFTVRASFYERYAADPAAGKMGIAATIRLETTS